MKRPKDKVNEKYEINNQKNSENVSLIYENSKRKISKRIWNIFEISNMKRRVFHLESNGNNSNAILVTNRRNY